MNRIERGESGQIDGDKLFKWSAVGVVLAIGWSMFGDKDPATSSTAPVAATSTTLAPQAPPTTEAAPAPVAAPAEQAPPPPPPPAPPEAFGIGEDYAEILVIEQNLIKAGCLKGTADTVYGEDTKAAVEWLQRNAGLADDGIFGPKSNRVLQAEIAAGETDCGARVNIPLPAASDRAGYEGLGGVDIPAPDPRSDPAPTRGAHGIWIPGRQDSTPAP